MDLDSLITFLGWAHFNLFLASYQLYLCCFYWPSNRESQ